MCNFTLYVDNSLFSLFYKAVKRGPDGSLKATEQPVWKGEFPPPRNRKNCCRKLVLFPKALIGIQFFIRIFSKIFQNFLKISQQFAFMVLYCYDYFPHNAAGKINLFEKLFLSLFLKMFVFLIILTHIFEILPYLRIFKDCNQK